jgi:hypothetical protein
MQMKISGITNVDFGIIDQLLIKFSISSRYWTKNGSLMVQYISYFKEAYDSFRWEILYNILIEFGIPSKLVRLI